jgi:protein phosphatase 2C family protein 2/3
MTVLIVALLHGRTKEEWYSWVTERVKNEYGYKTPTTLPQLYAQSRINSFRARKEAMEARERQWSEKDDTSQSFLTNAGLGGFARVLGSTGGISFHPSSGIMTDEGHTLMFADDDDMSDDDSSGEDEVAAASSSFFGDTLGVGRADGEDGGSDSTTKLKEQLSEFEEGLKAEAEGVDRDGDSAMKDETSTNDKETGEPSEQKPSSAATSPNQESLPNGTPEQLKPIGGGDEAHPATKAEGPIDGTEDPLVKSTTA